MPKALSLPPHRLSIVVPLYNERDNVAPLAARVHEALADYAHPWELILVDDGSSDDTLKHILEAEKCHGSHVRPVELTRNFKQTAAMQAGVDAGGMIASVHFITTGVLSEIMARIYFESGSARPYWARPTPQLADDDGWRN